MCVCAWEVGGWRGGGVNWRVVINRGAAIILGNTGSARSRRSYVYMRKRSQLLGLTSYI